VMIIMCFIKGSTSVVFILTVDHREHRHCNDVLYHREHLHCPDINSFVTGSTSIAWIVIHGCLSRRKK
jgi:hypothetical protein